MAVCEASGIDPSRHRATLAWLPGTQGVFFPATGSTLAIGRDCKGAVAQVFSRRWEIASVSADAMQHLCTADQK